MPEIDKLIPLARLFGVTADYLLDDTQEAPSEKPQPAVPHQRPENPHFVQAFPFATLLDCAGLLCSAIISDTLLFRSPTCTETDKTAALALAQLEKEEG